MVKKVEEKTPATSFEIGNCIKADLACVHFNEFSEDIDVFGYPPLPWERDKQVRENVRHWGLYDDDKLVQYVEQNFFTNVSPDKVMRAFRIIAHEQSYHPIRDYLTSLESKWDWKERCGKLLQKYFGAKDSPYVQEAMLVTLKAAVARAYKPGTKFDTMLVLIGSQGCGKSTFCRNLAELALGAGFFSDSLSMSDTRDKTAAEKLLGSWIIELAEADGGITRTDVQYTKQFLSSCDDKFRASYAPRATHHPRQCIFIGTTNSDSFLRDDTGNRRFFPIQCPGVPTPDGTPLAFSMTKEEVDQIWAEAVVKYFENPSLTLSQEARREAEQAQRDALDTDDREGVVEEFLKTLLPVNWEKWTTEDRRNWLKYRNYGQYRNVPGTEERKCVCTEEIWQECLGNDTSTIPQRDSRAIKRILLKLGWRAESTKRTVPLYGRQWCFFPFSPEN